MSCNRQTCHEKRHLLGSVAHDYDNIVEEPKPFTEHNDSTNINDMTLLIRSWADFEDINDDHDNFIKLPWSVTDHEENDNEHKNSAEVLVVPFSASTSPSKISTFIFQDLDSIIK